jgi:aspartate/methionine/tyrosine aminotransferase
MHINEFKLERYFSKYEFNTEYLLSSSDCESLGLEELLELSDEEGKKLWNNLSLGYTETTGHPLLRQEISNLYENIDPEDVLIITPAEGIFIALNILLNEGDHVIAIFPAYQSLYEIPNSLGCSLSEWPMELNNNKWSLDLDLLEKTINKDTKMLIINFPHNPSGFIPDVDSFNRLLDIVKRHDLYLFSDEMYKFSEYNPDMCLDSPGEIYHKGISLSGLSKSFGLPGLRIGWLISKNRDLLDKFVRFKDYTTICSSAPAEILGIIALRSKEKILRRNLNIIKGNLRIAEDFFASYNNIFNWLAPQAGPIAFPKLEADILIDEFCKKLVEDKNVMLLPGSVFSSRGNHFRLGLGRRNFKEGLERVEEFVQKIF